MECRQYSSLVYRNSTKDSVFLALCALYRFFPVFFEIQFNERHSGQIEHST
ncbi:MAG: hypothetical protein K0U68_00850 [Gammaproteobacteria bacterium]|nr:hypothetical protein [Gammaproteobacteria bacterium]